MGGHRGWRNFERRIRRIAGEIFVGKDLDAGGMIHRQKFHLVEVNGFFERLHETEAKFAVFLYDCVSRSA